MICADRPDPATDLVGALRWIMDSFEKLNADIVAIHAGQDERRVNATDAAKALGFPPKYFHNTPWRVPGFGAEGRYYTLATWRAWVARPEADRRAEWDAMSLPVRQKVRGVA